MKVFLILFSALIIIIIIIFIIGILLFYPTRTFLYIPGSEYTLTFGKPYDPSNQVTTSVIATYSEKEVDKVKVKSKINDSYEVIINKNTLFYIVNKNHIVNGSVKDLYYDAEISLIWEKSNNLTMAKKIYILNDL